MLAVSNTSPLIFLAKVPELIDLSKRKFEKIIIPREVYSEAVERGLSSEDHSIRENALRIKKLVEGGFIEVRELKEVKLKNSLLEDLGLGEASAIALALQEKIENVLIDERGATTIARTFKLKPRPISLLPIEAFKNNQMSKEDALRLLDELLINNYYLSSEDYKRIISLLGS
ncbi:MAG: hypothetical protein QMC77_00070 [Methanocellales archaeon]|nr:hypothetical protein [Methanocellales archaeon]